ncbi:MAG: ATP synthase F1 subunit delta [Alphaproteobacteria bacterium]|nr:ATP synthase F1 subunit delta [Alphaproteobacteria bacterium]
MKQTSKVKLIKNYARALMNAALDAGTLEKTKEDINKLAQVSDISSIGLPLLEHQQQKELLSLLEQKIRLQKTTVNFLQTLVQNRAFNLFFDIVHEFNNMILAKNNVAQVLIETAQPLSKAQEERLIKGLRIKLKQDVVLSYNINENILGGLILRIGSLEIDDSLAHKIKTLDNIMKG